jgi:hypothetical protein
LRPTRGKNPLTRGRLRRAAEGIAIRVNIRQNFELEPIPSGASFPMGLVFRISPIRGLFENPVGSLTSLPKNEDFSMKSSFFVA